MSNEILHKQIVEKFNSIFSDPPPEVSGLVEIKENLIQKNRKKERGKTPLIVY